MQNLLLDTVKIRSSATNNLYAYEIPPAVAATEKTPERHHTVNGSPLPNGYVVDRISSKVHETDKQTVINPHALHRRTDTMKIDKNDNDISDVTINNDNKHPMANG